jgi:hypothetical protein
MRDLYEICRKRRSSRKKFKLITKFNKKQIYEELSRNRGYFSVAVVDGPVSDIFLVRSNYKIFESQNRFRAGAYPFNVHCLISPTTSFARRTARSSHGARSLGSININNVYKCDLSLFSKAEEALFYSEKEAFHRGMTFKFHRAGYTPDVYGINYLVREQLRWAMRKVVEHISNLENHLIFSYESEKLEDDLIIENITKYMVLARSVGKLDKPELKTH